MNDPDTPLVTALVTFHNQAPFVAPALDSVLAQTYPKLEIVVVDDGSTDDTRARCLAYGDRIRFVTRPNGGASAARNTGLVRARGSYIAHLDGDDLWHPDKIAVQVDAARRFPEAGMVVVDGHKFRDDGPDEPGLIRGAVGARLATAPEGRLCVPCYDAVMRGHFVATPSQFMVPTAVYHVLGPWETRLRLIADSEMLLRIALRYPIAFVAGDYVGYRYLPSSISGPEETRGFSWGLELFPMLRFHRRHAGAAHEAVIRARTRTSVTTLAQNAYYRGHRVDRAWARRYLLQLLVASRQPLRVWPYLAGMVIPAALVAAGSRLRRDRSGRDAGARRS